jgi:hypothetical protein
LGTGDLVIAGVGEPAIAAVAVDWVRLDGIV